MGNDLPTIKPPDAQQSATRQHKPCLDILLIEEYGNDAVVDLKTGEVKPPEKKEENGENK